MQRLCLKFIFIILILVISGCSATRTGKRINTLFVNNLPSSENIEIQPISTEYKNDVLVVSLKIINKSENGFDDILYRFKWYDPSGYEVGMNNSIWKPLFLDPKDIKIITQLAPSPKAEQYKFYIKQQKKKNIRRIDPNSLESDSLCYGVEELHLFIDKMVSSMLSSKLFDGRPIIDIGNIENTTGEKIDTIAIVNGIRTAMIKSGRAKFIDSSFRNIINCELEYQNNSKYIDKKSINKIGKQLAPNYILNGSISSIKKREDYFYKITLQLHNIQNGVIEWADEKEIRKVDKNAKQ